MIVSFNWWQSWQLGILAAQLPESIAVSCDISPRMANSGDNIQELSEHKLLLVVLVLMLVLILFVYMLHALFGRVAMVYMYTWVCVRVCV